MEKSIMRQKRKLGLSIGILLIVSNVMGLLFSFLISKSGILTKENSVWIEYTINAVAIYVVGFLVIKFMLRKVENVEQKPKVKLKPGKLLFYIFVTISTGIFFSLITNKIITIVNSALNIEIGDRINDIVQKSNPFALIIFVAILAPIFEELIFRGVLLKKLRVYGDKTAIIYTAIAFGIFHSNVSQIVFATILGLIFAYVAVKTNDIKYPIILHITMNSVSTLVNVCTYYNLQTLAGLISLALIVITLGGVIALPIKAANSNFQISNESKYSRAKLYKNIGYILSVIVVIIITVLGSIKI